MPDGAHAADMNPVSAIALSGLNASTLRVRAAASNIANAQTKGATDGQPGVYVPLDVLESVQANGGVAARIAPSSRSALLAYDPGAPYANAQGYVATPDVDMVAETIGLAMASHAFTANLAVLRTADDMERSLLDLKV